MGNESIPGVWMSSLTDTNSGIKLLRLDCENERTQEKLNPPLFRWGLDLVGHRAPNTELPGLPISSSIWSLFEQTEESHLQNAFYNYERWP